MDFHPFYILPLALVAIYGVFILKLFLIYSKAAKAKSSKKHLQSCSIIIPFRNEEKKLNALLESIASLEFPKDHFEIILIDDHSEDLGFEIVEKFIDENPDEPYLVLKNEKREGKKGAIAMGIAKSRFDIILQTDADCVVPSQWIWQMMEPFNQEEVSAVLGKVNMKSNSGYLGKIMALEFASLQASGISLALMQIPIMSNAANMAYRKSRVPENLAGKNSDGGDDVLLIQSLSKADPLSVKVALDSVVSTLVPETVLEFFKQRLRWGSETPNYPLTQGKWIAALVFLLSLSQVFLLLLGIWKPGFFILFGFIYFLKLIPDYLLLKAYLKNEQDKNLLVWVPLMAVVYPFYISITVLYILFGSANLHWKDRPMRR